LHIPRNAGLAASASAPETDEDAANRVRDTLQGTHFVEPEIRRSLT